MTKSQITTAVGGTIAFIGGLTTALTPFLPFVPAKYKDGVQLAFGLLAAVGAALAAFNQSLSGEHASLPMAEVKALAAGAVPRAPDDALVSAALSRIREMAAGKEGGR